MAGINTNLVKSRSNTSLRDRSTSSVVCDLMCNHKFIQMNTKQLVEIFAECSTDLPIL